MYNIRKGFDYVNWINQMKKLHFSKRRGRKVNRGALMLASPDFPHLLQWINIPCFLWDLFWQSLGRHSWWWLRGNSWPIFLYMHLKLPLKLYKLPLAMASLSLLVNRPWSLLEIRSESRLLFLLQGFQHHLGLLWFSHLVYSGEGGRINRWVLC